jgi:hypothetical protein
MIRLFLKPLDGIERTKVCHNVLELAHGQLLSLDLQSRGSCAVIPEMIPLRPLCGNLSIVN